MSTHRFRVLALAAVAAALALAACGDGASDASPTALSATPTASSSGTPSPTTTATVSNTAPGDTDPPTTTPAPSKTATPAPAVTILSPVDKDHALPADYVPPGLAAIPLPYLAVGYDGELRQEALDALIEMLDDAAAAGHDIRARSAYRSYATQEATFNFWVNSLGYDEAIRVSAMAGHSEHQLGTTVDLSSPEVGWGLVESFGDTAGGKWLAAHAHEYGFALSYPRDAEAITGYSYEPWHFRYIGAGEAEAWKASGLKLNQYLLR